MSSIAPSAALTSSSGAASIPPPPPAAAAAVSTSANLSNSVINLGIIKEQSRRRLVDILDSVHGKKALVIDPKFSGPLGVLAEASLLREHGVEKIYHITPGKLQTEFRNIIYLTRPRIQLMKFIAEHITNHQREQLKKDYFVFFVPRRAIICERTLQEEGVFEAITFGDYYIDLIPFEDDLLSLELDGSFRECFLEGDRTSLYHVSKSLMRLQHLFGIIPNIKAKGLSAKLVLDMMVRMRKEIGTDTSNRSSVPPEIDQLILIDRDVDLITPMCTQLTYEGLIDETFGILNGITEVDPEIIGGQKHPEKKKQKVALNSSDKLFAVLRDLNFSVLGPILNKKAKEIDEYYKLRHDAKTVTQIRDFMRKFADTQAEHASLRIHAGIAEHILNITKNAAFHRRLETEQSLLAGVDVETSVNYIEESIAKHDPLMQVLRMVALYSLTNGGMKSKQFEFIKREILQTYGFEHLPTLDNLEKLGFIRKQESKNTFGALRKGFHLIVEDIDEQNPQDIAFVYSGYAPLSVRVIQSALKPGGWKSREDLLRLLSGPTVEESQSLSKAANAARARAQTIPMPATASRNGVTLVFYIGGITFTEIAALRWLSEQNHYGEIVIATTKLINGNTLLSAAIENVVK